MFLALYFWHNTGVTFALFRLSKDLKTNVFKVKFILTNFSPHFSVSEHGCDDELSDESKNELMFWPFN